MVDHGGLREIKVPHIVLAGYSAARRSRSFHISCSISSQLLPFRHDIVLVEDVAEEVPAIELADQVLLNLGRQRLEPVLVVPAERDVERDAMSSHLPVVHRAIADRGAGGGEAVQEGLVAFVGRALEVVAGLRRKDRL